MGYNMISRIIEFFRRIIDRIELWRERRVIRSLSKRGLLVVVNEDFEIARSVHIELRNYFLTSGFLQNVRNGKPCAYDRVTTDMDIVLELFGKMRSW